MVGLVGRGNDGIVVLKVAVGNVDGDRDNASTVGKGSNVGFLIRADACG